jgi:hypothetical protein
MPFFSWCGGQMTVSKVGLSAIELLPEKYIDNVDLQKQMDWAGSFILLLPLPVCLIDKKGFYHHGNEEFHELITVTGTGNVLVVIVFVYKYFIIL